MSTTTHDLVDRLGRISGPAAVSDLGADEIGAIEEALVVAGYLESGMSHEADGIADALVWFRSDFGLGSDNGVDAGMIAQLTALVSSAGGTAEPAAVPEPLEIPDVAAAQKSDDELAVAIIEHEYEILDQWDKALEIFQTVMTSAADSETKPDFVKALTEHFKEKVLGRLAEEAPQGTEALEVLNLLGAEVERATKAKESATLRDFIIDHKEAVADVQKQLTALKDDFRARVRLTEQAMWSGDQAKQDEYGIMRMHLVEYFEDVDRRLRSANTDAFFQLLSEEWVRGATISHEYGVDAYISIHVEEDFTIREAEIKGPGADKLAEQLLKDDQEGDGVDVFAMRVPRRVLCYRRGESYPYAMVKLDENNNLTNDGSFVEGNYMPIYEWLMQNGLPPTKNLNT
jgi:hypothetical protein